MRTDSIPPPELPKELGDFTATRRLVPISLVAVLIGVTSALLALALLDLISLFTNVFFYQRWTTQAASPAGHHLGVLSVFAPVIGGLIVGLMARYGSERIRGHGIPEALEAILLRGSRIEPKVALLKPISAAVSIGSGGPFGAEGPIIMTGGAFGSMVAQLFHLTSAERKTLLVAGAAGGMSATFAAPVASVLLAVELLLFELKPRSYVPVALASASAMLTRYYLLGPGPLFHVPTHAAFIGGPGLLGAAAMGLCIGALAYAMTFSVYSMEDLFKRLPIHWMWWPALGGLAVGIGGLVYPRALGVGYDTIEAVLQGNLSLHETALLVIVKWTIWAVCLGSGTSGGVLAPLLMIGSAIGGVAGMGLPDEGVGFWALIGLGTMLSSIMGSPLTGVVFAIELTGDRTAVLPLLVASMVAYGFTVLTMKRSILTEKVARRGFHVTREYAIDPLEVLFVRDVMDTPPADDEVEAPLSAGATAHSDESLGSVVQRMALTGYTRLAVVTRGSKRQTLGIVTLAHLLEAKRRHLEEEQRRERMLSFRELLPLPRAKKPLPAPGE